jgi:recombination protein RecA
VLEIGVLHGVLEKSGAWNIYNRDRLGHGKDNARDFLKENAALAKEIEAKIREKVMAGGSPAAADKAEEPSVDKKVEHLPTRKRGGSA